MTERNVQSPINLDTLNVLKIAEEIISELTKRESRNGLFVNSIDSWTLSGSLLVGIILTKIVYLVKFSENNNIFVVESGVQPSSDRKPPYFTRESHENCVY
jgi:hypothetical protein